MDSLTETPKGMLISCAISPADLGVSPSDLVLLPEGVQITDVREAAAHQPAAVVVAAVVEGTHCRAIVHHREGNRIDYLKVHSDGRTVGSGNYAQSPVYELPGCCIGVLVCMDVNDPTFARSVIDRVRQNSAPRKIICIPADMDASWFVGNALPFPQTFAGMHVILSNHSKTYGEHRCRSFITDIEGRKVRIQTHAEAIHYRLP